MQVLRRRKVWLQRSIRSGGVRWGRWRWGWRLGRREASRQWKRCRLPELIEQATRKGRCRRHRSCRPRWPLRRLLLCDITQCAGHGHVGVRSASLCRATARHRRHWRRCRLLCIYLYLSLSLHRLVRDVRAAGCGEGFNSCLMPSSGGHAKRRRGPSWRVEWLGAALRAARHRAGDADGRSGPSRRPQRFAAAAAESASLLAPVLVVALVVALGHADRWHAYLPAYGRQRRGQWRWHLLRRLVPPWRDQMASQPVEPAAVRLSAGSRGRRGARCQVGHDVLNPLTNAASRIGRGCGRGGERGGGRGSRLMRKV